MRRSDREYNFGGDEQFRSWTLAGLIFTALSRVLVAKNHSLIYSGAMFIPSIRLRLAILTLALTWLAGSLAGADTRSTPIPAATSAHERATILLEFFYEPGCDDCARVEQEILPELEGRYGGFYTLAKLDVGVASNYLRLAGYQEALGHERNATVSLAVNGHTLFNGFTEIQARLFDTLDRTLAPSAPPIPAPAPSGTLDTLRQRIRHFTPLSVMAAGLMDGLNPCAISTLVFFMSLLAMARISGGRLLLAGGAFCLASFATYLGIGLGLLRALHTMPALGISRAAVDGAMLILLLVFAGLSFRDAWRFRAGGHPNDILLRLPRPVVLTIHAVMRRGLKSRHLILGGAGIGSVVTILESICTGQVYVPTLILVLRTGGPTRLALGYLVLYNILFTLPLITILALTWKGTKTEALLDWSHRHVVFSKCMLGVFFLAMAGLLMLLK